MGVLEIEWSTGLTTLFKQRYPNNLTGPASRKDHCPTGDIGQLKIRFRVRNHGGTATSLWKDKGALTMCAGPSGIASILPGTLATI